MSGRTRITWYFHIIFDLRLTWDKSRTALLLAFSRVDGKCRECMVAQGGGDTRRTF